jgi:hypothetical protein
MTTTERRPTSVRYRDEDHVYWLSGGTLREEGWVQVPSVTEVLEALTPFHAGPWWGMRVGMASVVEMMRHVGWGEIANANTAAEIIKPKEIERPKQYFTKADHQHKKPRALVEAWCVDNQRSVNHLRDRGGTRGESVHVALQKLALDTYPDINQFPEEDRGYVQGLMRWWFDQEPQMLLSEVIVGSTDDRYAGRFDLVCRYPAGRIVMTDLKTSASVHKSHLRQLALYARAFDEMDMWPAVHNVLRDLGIEKPITERVFDALEVLHVTAEGEYSLVPSMYRPEHVLPLVRAWHAEQAGWSRHPADKAPYTDMS